MDLNGVSLAAIKGLYATVKELQKRVEQLEQEAGKN